MKTLELIKFSDMHLGEGSIRHERRQVKLYEDLVKDNPGNQVYKKTLSELTKQLEEDEKLLALNKEPCQG